MSIIVSIICYLLAIGYLVKRHRLFKNARVVHGKCLSTKVYRPDSERSTRYQSTFLIDGREYREEKAKSGFRPKVGQDTKVILYDDGSVMAYSFTYSHIIFALLLFAIGSGGIVHMIYRIFI